MTNYWVAGLAPMTDRAALHKEECHYIQRANTKRQATELEISELAVCHDCRGDRVAAPADRSIYEAAVAAGRRS